MQSGAIFDPKKLWAAAPVPSPAYIFAGGDEFLRQEAIYATAQRLVLDELRRGVNLTVLDGREASGEEAVQAMGAVSLFVPVQAVVVTDYDQMSGDSLDRIAEGLEPRIVEYHAKLKQALSSASGEQERWAGGWRSYLFLSGSSVDKRRKLYKLLSGTPVPGGKGTVGDAVVEIARPKPSDGVKWLGQRAKQLKVRLSSTVAQAMIDALGLDFRLLDQELAKLATYVGAEGEITLDHLKEVGGSASEYVAFEITNAIYARDRAGVVKAFRELVQRGTAPQVLLAMVAKAVRKMLLARAYMDRGIREDEVAGLIADPGRGPAYPDTLAVQGARRYSLEHLTWALRRLARADMEMKTSRLPVEMAVEMALVDVCAGPEARGQRA